MSHHILWPAHRFIEQRDVEIESVGNDCVAEFANGFEEVDDATWARAEAIVSYIDIPQQLRGKLENCRIFVTPKVGFDNIDRQGWGKLGVPVCNVPDYGTQEVADHAIALMLALMKGITFHTRELKQDVRGNWRPALNPFGRRLSVCTFGIVGIGRIGTAAALRAKAFGMRVLFFDPHVENGRDLSLGIERVDSLAELFARSDVVSLHAPLTAETHNMINAEVLAGAKRGLILVNTARGPIIDLDALHDALRKEQVQAAGLDVLPEEPANPQHPLLDAWSRNEPWIDHRLLITPHSAFFTPESVYDMRFKGGAIAATYLTTGQLQNCVNAEHLRERR